ncbi:MAG: hypothetical protein K2Q06_16685, partial [Parvularculaceae bacterium]|nr:hypothetical protein [Parvularculaceae bacterium]
VRVAAEFVARVADFENIRRVADAMTATSPHSRYTTPARYLPSLMARNLLPSALTDRVFERVIGLRR